MLSWKRCIKAGVMNNLEKPALLVDASSLEEILLKNSMQISVFNQCVESIKKVLSNDYTFLLVDASGVLIKKAKGAKSDNFKSFVEGMSFLEESIGNSAVSISIETKKTFYTISEYHYCSFLKNSAFYSIPLPINYKDYSYLVLISSCGYISNEMIVISDLLSRFILNEFNQHIVNKNIQILNPIINLNQRQLEVLQLLAKGMPDKIVAAEMNLSVDTIKYHKRNIFKKLNVTCTIEAILKAIKLKILTVEQIQI